MNQLQNITASEILDNLGNPAISITVYGNDGVISSSSSATNELTAKYAIKDIQDNDIKRFQGHGLLQAIQIVETIIKPSLLGKDIFNQQDIDKTLINLYTSENKNNIGGNVLNSISKAVSKAAAKSKKLPLYKYLQNLFSAETIKIPVPAFTAIDGVIGVHHNTDFYEFIILPATNKSFKESLEIGSNTHKLLSQILQKENILPYTGENGGLAPILSTNEDALSLLKEAFEMLNIRLGYDIFLGINVKANSFYKEDHYYLKDHNLPLNKSELINFYADLVKKYHLLYLEDPMNDDDINGWSGLYSFLSADSIIAGDSYTATNPLRLQEALQKKTINGIVIKPSDIGTVSESLAVALMAKTAGIKIIVADNLSTTNDTFLADLSVAISADYARFGSVVRGERTIKYNRLLQIDKELNG